MIPEEPVDLEPLGDYLDSARSPDPVPPDEWLPMVWDEEDPEFADDAEADLIMGTMFARYNEISDGLDGAEPGYDPVYWRDFAGRTVVEDWSIGFMRAVGLRREAWEGVLETADGAKLFIPIVAVASLTSAELDPEDVGLSGPDMDELMKHADTVLASCVVGLHAFWRERSTVARMRLTVPAASIRKPH